MDANIITYHVRKEKTVSLTNVELAHSIIKNNLKYTTKKNTFQNFL